MAAAPHASHVSAKARAADAANLRKARAAQRGKPRTARQKAASRSNLVKARAARSRSAQQARRSGAPAVTAKRAAAPPPRDLDLLRPVPAGDDRSLYLLPSCGPVALAEHLQYWTGAIVPESEILDVHRLLGGAAKLTDLFELAASRGFGGDRLAWFEPCDPDAEPAPGLIYGIRLPYGYHAAFSAAAGILSWGQYIPRIGSPEEGWWLEWEGE
jgi:hypothetical protein